jgi:hypothetical protein
VQVSSRPRRLLGSLLIPSWYVPVFIHGNKRLDEDGHVRAGGTASSYYRLQGLITGAQAPHSAGRWHGNRLLHTGSPWLDGCHHMHTHGAPSKDRVTETPTFRNPSQGHRLGSRNLHDHATGDAGRHIGSPNSVSSPVTYGGGGCHTEERRLRYADLGQRMLWMGQIKLAIGARPDPSLARQHKSTPLPS